MIRCFRTSVFTDGIGAHEDEFSPVIFESMSTFLKDVKDFLLQHKFNLYCLELVFLGLSSGQRRVLHKIAEECGLIHFSRNISSHERALFVTDRSCLSHCSDLLYDAIFIREYVCLEGAMIEACAAIHSKKVPTEWIDARKKRDCMDMHHITLMSKTEVRQMLSSDEFSAIEDEEERKIAFINIFITICDRVAKDIPVNSWESQGMGKVEHEGSTAVFVIVSWPFGDLVRSRLELDPADFHITLGFYPSDVNVGPRKDTSSRIADNESLLEMNSEINKQNEI